MATCVIFLKILFVPLGISLLFEFDSADKLVMLGHMNVNKCMHIKKFCLNSMQLFANVKITVGFTISFMGIFYYSGL